ncbi:MAG TPA: tail fiber protein [Xanthobacteraceae bacterium]|jgi:microcystin-dependent protein
MSAPFVAEIRIFPFNFAPRGWAMCDGQLLPISQNTALFSLLGTNYGGDGKSTFALPNLQGSVPIHTDQYSGGGQYPIGAQGGSQFVQLLTSEIPLHSHLLQASTGTATSTSPSNAVYMQGQYNDGQGGTGAVELYVTLAPNATFNPATIAVAGGGQPHNNMMPYLTFNFCIAMQGVFPARP